MSMLSRVVVVLLLGLFLQEAQASSVVEAMQMPAWVKTGEDQRALQIGMNLSQGDEITTGKGARVYLRLVDGSLVKLGADTRMNIDLLVSETQDVGVLGGLLDVVQGAFRFTTDAARRGYKRDLKVRFGSVVAGVRGTDLWGSADGEKDLVCLIEGSIRVTQYDKFVAVLDEPLTHVRAEKGQAAGPVVRLDAKQLAIWAAKTETQPGEGVINAIGAYVVNLLTADTRADAGVAARRLAAAGYAVDIIEGVGEGRSGFSLRIGGLASLEDANALADSLRGRLGVVAPWVSGP